MTVPVLKFARTDAFGKVVAGRSAEIVALEESVAALTVCKDAPEHHKNAFYPEVTSPAQAEADIHIAKSYCRRCPAEAMCLQLAFLTDAGRWGVWGGTTERERRNIRRRLKGPGRGNPAGLKACHDRLKVAAQERVDAGEKRCSQCREVKPLDDFGRLARSLDGRDYECKACRSARRRAGGQAA